MKRLLLIVGLVLIPLVGTYSSAQDGPVELVTKGCKAEIETNCKDVTPGEGRVLACLYAYGDKLSSGCEYALYEASAQLEHFIQTVNYLANECEEDLKKYCSVIKPGEGRLLDCLEKNKEKVSSSCKQAFENISKK
jgi:Cysteine rich repeat